MSRSEHPECVTPQDTTPPELRAILGDALAKRKQVSLNGATAYREGAAQSDNPFCRQRQANDWQGWQEAFLRAQIHFVGR